MIGKGHSPEHALLHCPEMKLLISGNQVPPEISSNVSVQPLEPAADPLTDWLETLEAIRQKVSDNVLVLPAHGKPFHGLHARIGALIEGHEVGLAHSRSLKRRNGRSTFFQSCSKARPIEAFLVLPRAKALPISPAFEAEGL
nr:hypothetical protein [Sphingobium sp. EP60837]